MTLERCEEIRKKLDDYREGKLEGADKTAVERHLFYCPDCIFLLTLVTVSTKD